MRILTMELLQANILENPAHLILDVGLGYSILSHNEFKVLPDNHVQRLHKILKNR